MGKDLEQQLIFLPSKSRTGIGLELAACSLMVTFSPTSPTKIARSFAVKSCLPLGCDCCKLLIRQGLKDNLSLLL